MALFRVLVGDILNFCKTLNIISRGFEKKAAAPTLHNRSPSRTLGAKERASSRKEGCAQRDVREEAAQKINRFYV